MSNGERTFSEDKMLGFYRERAWSENCSISSLHRLKMLAESSRKAGKSLGRTGWAVALQRLPSRSMWSCSPKSLGPSISTSDLFSAGTVVTSGPWARSCCFMAFPSGRGCLFPFICFCEDSDGMHSASKRQSFLNGVKKGCFPDPSSVFMSLVLLK